MLDIPKSQNRRAPALLPAMRPYVSKIWFDLRFIRFKIFELSILVIKLLYRPWKNGVLHDC